MAIACHVWLWVWMIPLTKNYKRHNHISLNLLFDTLCYLGEALFSHYMVTPTKCVCVWTVVVFHVYFSKVVSVVYPSPYSLLGPPISQTHLILLALLIANSPSCHLHFISFPLKMTHDSFLISWLLWSCHFKYPHSKIKANIHIGVWDRYLSIWTWITSL